MSESRDRAFWERQAKNYARSMLLLGGPVPRMVALAADGVRGAAKVLEVAAGTGLVTSAIARTARTVVATDYAEAMVAVLGDRVRSEGLTNVRCEQADLYALRFESNSFDAVVAANVLHLVPDLAKALSALRRVLKPGGQLIAPTYCHDETAVSWAVSRMLTVTGFPGQRRFTCCSLRTSLEVAGLEVVQTEKIRGIIPIGYVRGRFAT